MLKCYAAGRNRAAEGGGATSNAATLSRGFQGGGKSDTKVPKPGRKGALQRSADWKDSVSLVIRGDAMHALNVRPV